MIRNALITGASGTVGTALSAFLTKRRIAVTAWDREAAAIDDPAAMETFIKAAQPDIIYHLATDSTPTGIENEGWRVNVEWTESLAEITQQIGIKFVFTSSVMVFTDDARGPFTPDSEPDASEGYGYEKREAEKRVLAKHPGALIARLGWQIGEFAGSNNMIDFFSKQMEAHGVVEASRQWYPACSFIADTVGSLLALSIASPGGLYLLDSNACWTFHEIASALNELHGNPWQIEPSDDFVYDQRMLDRRNPIPSLKARLPGLPDPN